MTAQIDTTGLRIATVTLNPALDLVGQLTKIEIGEVNSVKTLGLYPAGKGINVAKVLADLGCKLSVTGFLGQDNQSDFVHAFQQYSFNDHFYRVAGKTRINVKITETEAEVTDLNFSGFEVSSQDWDAFMLQSKALVDHVDLLAVCGSLPCGINLEQFTNWLKTLQQQGVKLVLDSSNVAFNHGIQANPYLVKPNKRELEIWANQPLNSLEEIISAAQKLRSIAKIDNVIISMGAEGAIWLNDENILHAQPARCEQVVSTVGAGDSMVAGLIYGLSQGWNKAKTFTFATAASALAVSQSNVGINDRTALDPLIEQVKLTPLFSNT
ncbi:1-phosphofructokinase [Nicoletella semolina]|uniref:Phosphofructokinase n=1 Tax=Nicoletella semolina TaxID=271160 RepID=A0A4R2N6U2_9PAST|nr:1-phosphofructokinase [Nicoletella semolina]TCP16515.1 1-phosphofructokinase [Nicoletella semolina]